ncbi:hypothetical protein [Roseibium sp. RKSG952]|uniref:hypothetical protein n=1 Tax=Roseibium sp. RKSG952 TaxID=2529384 RepID=UPI0012BC52BC|nr:hypothetical protein [Roseibium sp. RKSG952]MTH99767.1 hypothetical protein [Roseibium sp. RKSG952]
MTIARPLQNRVLPSGEIVAARGRGLVMGNRGGRIHNPDTRTLTRRRWVSKRWICCRLLFKNRRRIVMGDSYTELFFLDEATALAAGHRPCFECRRDDATAFAAAFSEALGKIRPLGADDMDKVLHAERLRLEKPSLSTRDLTGLPCGTMVSHAKRYFLITAAGALPWSPSGYGEARSFAQFQGNITLLTPPSTLKALAHNYVPILHPSAFIHQKS